MVTAPTEIYTYCHTLSLHDALPSCVGAEHDADAVVLRLPFEPRGEVDRVAEHRIVEALARAHVADDALAGIDADADIERLELDAGPLGFLLALAVQHLQVAIHLEGGVAGLRFLIGHEIGRAHV